MPPSERVLKGNNSPTARYGCFRFEIEQTSLPGVALRQDLSMNI